MADKEPKVVISSATEGEVNGLSVTNVRSLTAMLADISVRMMRSGVVLPEEVASAFATTAANVCAVAYRDIEHARMLMQAAVDLLPDTYARLAEAEDAAAEEKRATYYLMRGPTTVQ